MCAQEIFRLDAAVSLCAIPENAVIVTNREQITARLGTGMSRVAKAMSFARMKSIHLIGFASTAR